MFGRKKVINPYRERAIQLNNEICKSYDSLKSHAQKTYIMEESLKVYIGADLEHEQKNLEEQKKKLRNVIACYDVSRTEYHKYIDEHQIPFVRWCSSHDVIYVAIKDLFIK